MPTTPNRVYLRMLVIGFVIIGYYRLHLSMYFNYAKTFIMCALVLFGTLFTAGVIGLIINIYCIYQSNKMLKNQKI
jgi:hypothetical protein